MSTISELLIWMGCAGLVSAANVLGLRAYWGRLEAALSGEAGEEYCCSEEEGLPPKRIPEKKMRIILCWMICVVSLAVAASRVLIYDNGALVNLRVMCLMGVLWPAGIIDAYEMRIPNRVLLLGLVMVVLIAAVELVTVPDSAGELLVRLIAAAVVFVVCILFLLLSRGGLGMGDVKLFALIGLYFGLSGLLIALFCSILLVFVAALVLLFLKKKKKNDELSFGPYILAGALLAMILTGM